MKYYITYNAFSHTCRIVTFAIINKNSEGVYIGVRITDQIYIASAVKEVWDRSYDYDKTIRTIK